MLTDVTLCWHELPLRNSLDIISARAIVEIIAEHAIQIVHAHLGRDYLVAAMACRRARCARLILTRHHYLPVSRNPIYRWMLEDVAAVIAVSSSVRQSIIERLGLPPERVHTIPNWIDPSRLKPIAREAARALFQIQARLAVACIGQITPAKGQEEFIRAASRVSQARSDVEFLIVGKEEDDQRSHFTRQLKALVEELGIGRRVRFLGHIEKMAELLSASDVVVVPSWDEGFSLVTIEAMAAGRPVLASDAGGIRDIIRENVTGLLFPPRNVNALASKLLWMLADTSLRERLGRQAQQDAMARFNREQIIDQIESLYLNALEQRSSP
jgi:glycosyltransferase involved in cell wall biosynthesis